MVLPSRHPPNHNRDPEFAIGRRVASVWNPFVMQITVTGQQIDVGDALRGRVEERLDNSVSKYFDHAIDAHVAFSHEGAMFRTQIRVHVGKGLEWESHADESDIFASFGAAVEHLEKQLRRHKRKLRDHHKGGDGEFVADED